VAESYKLAATKEGANQMADEHLQPEQDRHIRRDRDEDDVPRRRRRRDDDDDDIAARIRKPHDPTGGLIPYRNPKALIAYYLGVFSLIPCLGAALGPAALILGILGLQYHKRHETAGGMGHAIAGIVLGSLVTLGHLVVLLLIVLAGLSK
jgi:hypothetical protein